MFLRCLAAFMVWDGLGPAVLPQSPLQYRSADVTLPRKHFPLVLNYKYGCFPFV